MSLDMIKEQFSDFLAHEKEEVMAIQGEWGVGKTYSWNLFLREYKETIKLKRYSYVSLFGINSLDSLKYSIFENAIPKDSIGEEPSIETVRNNALGMLEVLSRKAAKIAREAPVIKNFTPTLESFSFMSVREMIIVIDDLERRGEGLKIKDVLGLVSLLKEHKKCKVVLLLNDNTDGMLDYVAYKEKVIDRDITFNPSAEECAAIAFDQTEVFHKQLSRNTISLGITNIRILKRIERLVKIILPKVNGNITELTEQITHSLVLFCWCHYSHTKDNPPPSLEYIAKLRDMQNTNEDKNIPWITLLTKYRYSNTSILDQVLIDYVKLGYVDSKDLNEVLRLTNIEIEKNKTRSLLSEAYKLFYGSFNDNEEAVVIAFTKAIEDRTNYITVNDLDKVVTILRNLDRNKLADDLIKMVLDTKSQTLMTFIHSPLLKTHNIEDSYLASKIEELASSMNDKVTIEDVLIKLVNQNGWSDLDEEILDHATTTDYYSLFKKLGITNGSSFIATALRFGTFKNSTPRQNSIANKARQAIISISNESKINKIRLSRFL